MQSNRRKTKAIIANAFGTSVDDPRVNKAADELCGPVQAAGLSLENQIAVGASVVSIPTAAEQFEADCQIAAMNVCKGAMNLEPLCLAYFRARRLLPTKSQYAAWHKAFSQMYLTKPNRVLPVHVTQACEKLASRKPPLTNADPFAIIKTAVDLANPAPGVQTLVHRGPQMLD